MLLVANLPWFSKRRHQPMLDAVSIDKFNKDTPAGYLQYHMDDKERSTK